MMVYLHIYIRPSQGRRDEFVLALMSTLGQLTQPPDYSVH